MITGAFIFLCGLLIGLYLQKISNKDTRKELIQEVKKSLNIKQKGYIVDLSEPIEITPLEKEEDTIK